MDTNTCSASDLYDESTASVEVELEDDRSKPEKVGELSPFYAKSWFCPVGIRKVLRELEPKLPDVDGSLFLTFTIDPSHFSGPETAFDRSRDRLRRIFHRLRKGIRWEGKTVKIDKPYCIKLEFHENGWPHFHSIFLTKRFLPGSLLNHLWKYGRTNVQRISNRTFRYLLKYVTKGDDIPGWVKERERIRIFQTSKGFYRKPNEPPKEKSKASKGGSTKNSNKKNSTIGERLAKWKSIALLKVHKFSYQQIPLNQPYLEMAGREALSAAKENRYLGNLRFSITHPNQIRKYIK